MNHVFLIGKIITDINFKFIINQKSMSITTFKIQTIDNQTINVKGYNEIADYIYSKLQKENFVAICGRINTDGVVTINTLEKLLNNLVSVSVSDVSEDVGFEKIRILGKHL